MASKPTYVSDLEWEEHEKKYGKKGVIAYGIDSNDKAVSILVNEDGSLVIDSKETTGMNGAPVTVGTSAVEMTFTGVTQSIKISSSSTNGGTIYIGKSNVASDGSNALDELVTGQSLILELNDASEPIYAVASIAAQTVYKMALT